MAITVETPNTVRLQGPVVEIGDLDAIEAITPGHLVEFHNDSGNLEFGVHDAEDDPVSPMFALEQSYLNKGVDDAYAAGDNCRVGVFSHGGRVWALIPSGENITQGDLLQSNGDGTLKELVSGTAVAVAIETLGAITATTRCRAQIL